MAGLGVAKTVQAWLGSTDTDNPQTQSVERNTDSVSYEAAHPDDTLILAGPPRYSQLDAKAFSNAAVPGLLPLGMVQQISFQQSKPTQPLMAVGSGRSFFASGKAQTAWSAARLWVNGNNLLRSMYAWKGKVTALDPSKMDDPASVGTNGEDDAYYINLDSELYYMPFGMMCLFRDKVHDYLGAFYVELCMISSWAASVSAGQSQIMEQVSGMADRILPISLSSVGAQSYTNREAAAAIVGLTTGSLTSDALNADNGLP